MPESTTTRRSAVAALALSLLIFAPSFAATKVSVDGLGVATSATIRLIGGGGLLLLIAHRSWPELRRHWRPLALLGVAGMGVQTLAISIGIDAGTASLGALILGLEPIFIALFGALLTHDRPSRATIAGLALGLAGVVVVSGVLTVGISGTPLVAVLALGDHDHQLLDLRGTAARADATRRRRARSRSDDDRRRPRDPAARARRAGARNRGA